MAGARGLTLVEVMMVIAILSVATLATYGVLTVSARTTQAAGIDAALQSKGTDVVDEIANELKESGITGTTNTVQPNPMVQGTPYASISFKKCIGYDSVSKGPKWSGLITYALAASGGQAVVRRTTSEGTVDIADGLPANGLTFTKTDTRSIAIVLTLQKQDTVNQVLRSYTARTAVTLKY